MARTEIKITKGDNKFDLNFTLKDYDGVAVNLTDATLKFKMQKPGTSTLKIDGTMNIVSASAGTCKYTAVAGNFDTAGTYNAEIEVTYTSGQIITFSDIIIKVQGDLPK